jgi:N-acetylglucosaminyl-diphospho-decaprenol L-rhamnosyltransferase
VKVSAVVVSHGHADELARSLPALVPQVDETVVVANLPGSVRDIPAGVRVLENPRPRPLAANVNLGIAATTGEYVLSANPDALPEPTAVAALVAFADAHPRCGIAGPQMRWPDGSWQPSRRRFPTVRGTVVRRTPLRRLRTPYETQREHYALDERPTEPTYADWMLGAFLLMRRTMLAEIGGWDAGYRHYCEDIDLCYRAARTGWERWYVPDAVVTHAYAAVID